MTGLDFPVITAGNETLMRQAPATATEYLHDGVKEIDAVLGEGFR